MQNLAIDGQVRCSGAADFGQKSFSMMRSPRNASAKDRKLREGRNSCDRDRVFVVGQLAALTPLSGANDVLGGGESGGWLLHVQRSSRALNDVHSEPEYRYEDECEQPRKLSSTGKVGASDHFNQGVCPEREQRCSDDERDNDAAYDLRTASTTAVRRSAICSLKV